jgi:single-strand selective monofunctional uracil DNA glycosylase
VSLIEQAMRAAKDLSDTVARLQFSDPVTHVYNPLEYAWDAHLQYLQMLNPKGAKVLFLGMNPGPWGMAQTGVPFGQIAAVRDWLKIDATIHRPAEVSGERLWGLFRERFKTPKAFFKQHFVANYCPLVFMESTARNRTPDKLPLAERVVLDAACDAHLKSLIEIVNPTWLVGVGAYAEDCLKRVAADDAKVTKILHPSPASPAANRGWAEAATNQLLAAGVWKAT